MTHLADGWPVFWEAARGANVRDVDGNVHLDLTSAFGVMLGGHAHPRVVEAARRQMDTLVHGMGDVHPPAIKVELMERLAALVPWDGAWSEPRVVLASAGSEAVEIALKTALLATGKSGVVAFEGGYHGLTLGALASTARPYFREPFTARLPDDVGFVPWPDAEPASAVDATLEALERLLAEGVPRGEGGDTAGAAPVGAVILEPVQGRGGVRLPPEGFLDEVVRASHDHGALVIADEIYTGVGRCGAPLAWTRLANRPPDLVCLGKTLGGGFPLSACLAPREVMDAWPASPGEALHTSTFLGHPVACATSIATLDLLEDGMDREAERVGRAILEGLRARLAECPGVREVRGVGAMLGIELEADGGDPRGVAVAKALLAEGVIVLPAGEAGEVVQLAPAVVLTEEQTTFAVEAVARAVEGASVPVSFPGRM